MALTVFTKAMENSDQKSHAKRVLLTGVFGPFGVDDEYGRKENIMELFHNQVTKGQGAASFRFHHRSFGLYFLAENIDADVTVLDFPSKRRFLSELDKGYDIIGISFIAPNFVKAKEMARSIREHSPQSEIILGGHGAAVEGLEQLIDCDHVVKGEGISWLRQHLGQDPNAPIVHPALPSTEAQSIFGVPIPKPTASLLVPGVGCVNGCNFCCTSHFFSKCYTPFINSGKALFETARRIADERGTDSFFIMDENFLKNRERAMELVEEMERHERFFRFHIFSSAEAISAFGFDNLVRLGVTMVWIGFESQSRQDAYAKNIGIDTKELVSALRDRGISVLGSGILCMEHHTPDNMHEDIDFLTDLNCDFVQFMLLTPLPVTALYQRHKEQGVLRDDIPFEEWHGQKYLIYRHPHFTGSEPEAWINRAFRQDYQVNGSSMYRVAETSLRGYLNLLNKPDRDANLEARLLQFRDQAKQYALMLPGVALNAVNEQERQMARALDKKVQEAFGRHSLVTRSLQAGAIALIARWKLRIRLRGDSLQPRTIVTHYRAGRRPLSFRIYKSSGEAIEQTPTLTNAAAAVSR